MVRGEAKKSLTMTITKLNATTNTKILGQKTYILFSKYSLDYRKTSLLMDTMGYIFQDAGRGCQREKKSLNNWGFAKSIYKL